MAPGTLAVPDEPDSPNRDSSKASSTGRPRSKASSRLNDFLERQSEPTPQFLIRRATSKVHRELVEDTRNADDAGLLGNQGPEGFRLLLSRKFGSVAAAWRVSLDPDGNGHISFGEFNHRCRQMGFTGNLRKIWGELDTEKTGFISLKEIDPKAHQELEDFRSICLDKHGNMLNAWYNGFNIENKPGVPETVFISRCQELGFVGDAHRLFKLLRTDWSRRELKLEDFDPQTGEAVYRADPCAEAISYGGGRKATMAPKPKAPLSPLILSRCNTSHNLKRQRSKMKTAPSSPMSHSLSATLLSPTVNRSPASTFGALDDWDLDGQGTVEGSPPRSPSRSRLGSKANTLKLSSLDLDEDVSPTSRPCSKARSTRLDTGEERWDVATPTRNSDYIRSCSKVQVMDRSLREEDKINADVGMMNKDELLLQLGLKYGSLRKAWNEVFDPFDSGKIGFQEFCDRMRNIGFLGDMKECWSALGAERDGVLRLRHLDRRSDELMQGFHNTLCDKYGNMLNAWQTAFDPQNRSLIDEVAFVKQCTEDGVEGDLVQLFHDLLDDPLKINKYKKMSLREFDLAAYQAFARMDTEMIVEAQKTEKGNPLEMSFDERQENQFSVKWTRAQSKVMRNELAERVKQENEADVGCETLRTLKSMLIKKYKNLAIAWKVALDPMGQGHLSKEDWYNAVRNRVGFHGDLRQLWSEAAKPGAGHISLYDLDPHAVQVLWDFRAFLLDAYGDIMTAWNQGLDPKKRGKIEEEDFAKRMKEIGYEDDIKKLWQLLLAEPHRKYVVLRDIDAKAADAFFRGDDKALTLYGTKSGPQASPSKWTGKLLSPKGDEDDEEAPGTPSGSPKNLALPGTPSKRRPGSSQSVASSRAPSNASVARSNAGEDEETAVYRPTRIAIWSEELGARKRQGAEMRLKQEMDLQVGPKCLDDYRRQLVNGSGSLAAAWRYRMDEECTGRMSFMQFVMAIDRCGGYPGSVKQLWAEISQEKDEVTFQDLDPDGFELLQAFGGWIIDNHQTFEGFWKIIEKYNDEQVDEAEFVGRCFELGLEGISKREMKRIFKMLLPEPSTGRTKLIQPDLKVLIIALPLEMKLAMRPKPATEKSVSEIINGTPKAEKEEEPTSASASPTSPLRPPSPASPTSPTTPRSPSRVKCSPELPVISVEEFRRTLKRLYGSVHAGWVKYLDVTEVGRVPKGEFVNRARSIGVTGHVAALFAELDVDKKGFITLQDLDPEVSKITKQFFSCVQETYGTIEEAWRKAFDVTKRKVVGKKEFAKGCEAIGFEGNSDKLFTLLKPEAGRTFLELSDLGRHAAATVKAPELPSISPEDFRKMLKKQSGDVVAGWRQSLDTSEVGRVRRGEFNDRTRAMGITGNVAALFTDLDVDRKGFITLQDVDPEVKWITKQFFKCIQETHGTVEEAWPKAFEVTKKTTVGTSEFAQGCEAIGFEGDAEKVFELFKLQAERTFLELSDLRQAAVAVKAHEKD